MNGEGKSDELRRRALLGAAAVTSGAAVVATFVPFVASMSPSERARAAGAPIEVDLAGIKEGEILSTEWRGRPVWVMRRSQEQIDRLAENKAMLKDPDSEASEQPEYCRNPTRSRRPDIMIALNVCTHLGCAASPRLSTGPASGISEDWPGGFYCPCHSSTYDLAGRVFKDKLAPKNLEVPPHHFVDDNTVVIGQDQAEV